MCKSQPILARTAHGRATANYRIVQQGWAKRSRLWFQKPPASSGFLSFFFQFLLSSFFFRFLKIKKFICGKHRPPGICSTWPATHFFLAVSRTAGPQVGTATAGSKAAAQGALPIWSSCLVYFCLVPFKVITINTAEKRKSSLDKVAQASLVCGDVVLSGRCHPKTARDIFSPRTTAVSRLAERKSNVAKMKSRVGEKGN